MSDQSVLDYVVTGASIKLVEPYIDAYENLNSTEAQKVVNAVEEEVRLHVLL